MKNYQFTPRLWPTLLTLLIFPILLALGYWQLNRAHEKQQLQQEYQTRPSHEPLSLKEAIVMSDSRFYPIKIKGHFDNQHTFLLDNRLYQHQVGYEIFTPFIPNTPEKAILVNRGWVGVGQNRAILPAITPLEGEQEITGILDLPPKTFTLGNEIASKNWPQRIQSVTLSALAKAVGYPLQSIVIMADPGQKGYPRNWTPLEVGPMRHWGYAVQWFALAGALLVIFVAVNFHRKR